MTDAASDASPRRFASPTITTVLGLAMMVSFGSSYYLMGVLAEPMARGLGADPALAFMALSGAFLISALLTGLSGRWTDRRGGREVLVCAALMFVVALLVMALARHPAMMVAGVLMLGCGMGIGFYGPANSLLVAIHGDGAKTPITAVSLIGAFGGAIGWPLTSWMVQTFGWQGACIGWALLHLCVCVPLFYAVLPSARQVVPTGRGDAVQSRVQWDVTLIRLAILFACGWWVATSMAAHLPRVLERLGLDPAQAAMAAGTMAIAAIVVRVAALLFSIMSAPTAALRVACLSHPLGAILALTAGKALAVAVAIGQGLGNGLLSVAAGVLPLHLYGRANYGQRQALMVMPARFAQAAAPLMFAKVLDVSVTLGLCVTSGLCLVMLIMTLGLERRAVVAPVSSVSV